MTWHRDCEMKWRLQLLLKLRIILEGIFPSSYNALKQSYNHLNYTVSYNIMSYRKYYRASMAQKLEDMLQLRVQEKEEEQQQQCGEEEEETAVAVDENTYDHQLQYRHQPARNNNNNDTAAAATTTTHPLFMSDQQYHKDYTAADSANKRRLLTASNTTRTHSHTADEDDEEVEEEPYSGNYHDGHTDTSNDYDNDNCDSPAGTINNNENNNKNNIVTVESSTNNPFAKFNQKKPTKSVTFSSTATTADTFDADPPSHVIPSNGSGVPVNPFEKKVSSSPSSSGVSGTGSGTGGMHNKRTLSAMGDLGSPSPKKPMFVSTYV